MTDGGTARRARFEALAGEVWEPLQRYLLRRCSPSDADDVLAEVLLVLWRRLDDVPPEALPWCYAVAARCLANARRAETRRLSLVRRVQAEPVAPPPEEDADLAEALALLRPKDREVLRLWAWEGLEPRDLAVVLGVTPNAAAVRLSRARQALRELLGKDAGAAGHRQGEDQEVTA